MVMCELGPTDAVKPPPIATKGEWISEGPAWAAEVLGILATERAYRNREHECLDRLRGQDLIR